MYIKKHLYTETQIFTDNTRFVFLFHSVDDLALSLYPPMNYAGVRLNVRLFTSLYLTIIIIPGFASDNVFIAILLCLFYFLL